MDDASQAVVEQGGMPCGDDAEKALDKVNQRLKFGHPIKRKQMENIRQCLVAFLALMRMHEAKQQHGVGEKARH